MFARGEHHAGIGVVQTVRRGDVDDVDGFVPREVGVAAVCFCDAGGADFVEEGLGAGLRGRGRGCDDGVADVVDISGCRVDEEVAGEC